MKCDVCNAETDHLNGGMGRKLCDWCYAVELRFREGDNSESYRGAYIICLVLISALLFILGVAIGKYLL